MMSARRAAETWVLAAAAVVQLAANLYLAGALLRCRSDSAGRVLRGVDEITAATRNEAAQRVMRQRRFALVVYALNDCPACLDVLQAVDAVAGEQVGGDPRALVVALRQTAAEATQVARQYGLSIPVVADEHGALVRALGAVETPVVLVVERGRPPRTVLREGLALTGVERAAVGERVRRALLPVAGVR